MILEYYFMNHTVESLSQAIKYSINILLNVLSKGALVTNWDCNIMLEIGFYQTTSPGM